MAGGIGEKLHERIYLQVYKQRRPAPKMVERNSCDLRVSALAIRHLNPFLMIDEINSDGLLPTSIGVFPEHPTAV